MPNLAKVSMSYQLHSIPLESLSRPEVRNSICPSVGNYLVSLSSLPSGYLPRLSWCLKCGASVPFRILNMPLWGIWTLSSLLSSSPPVLEDHT